MAAPRSEYTKNHATYHCETNARVMGNHCKVYGNGCTIYGNYCYVYDNDCIIRGAHCTVYGDNCTIYGAHAIVEGHGCRVVGAHARVRHSDCNTDGAEWCTYMTPGSSVTVGSGIGVVEGGSVVFGADGMTVTKDGVTKHISLSCSSSKRPAEPDDESDTRKRVPVPLDHAVQKAGDGDKECQICMDNRVDACLDPCRHTVLCVDCARMLYFDTDESKRVCPVCRKAFTRIDAVIIS